MGQGEANGFRIEKNNLALKWPAGNATHQRVSPKILPAEELTAVIKLEQAKGKKIVFTNGCFDLLHRGHLYILMEAKKLGDLLIVAVNSDSSVREIKGASRPIVPLEERAELLAALEMVDYVTSFQETDPYRLIAALRPDVLVKGGDWRKDEVIGGDLVEATGGSVEVIPYLQGFSTTKIVERIRGK
jgi:rfaE bifunctional protein nucleotidyltransferase chain/domain